jgi:hypothetical protein
MQRFRFWRRFVAPSAERLAEWMACDLSKLDLLVQRVDAQAQACDAAARRRSAGHWDGTSKSDQHQVVADVQLDCSPSLDQAAGLFPVSLDCSRSLDQAAGFSSQAPSTTRMRLGRRPNMARNSEPTLRRSSRSRQLRLVSMAAFMNGRTIVGSPIPPSSTLPVGAADSFTLAISHMEGKTAVIDLIRELRAPFSPEAAVEQFGLLLRQYSINVVRGDRYGGLWPQEQFTKRGITYEPSERSRANAAGVESEGFPTACQ